MNTVDEVMSELKRLGSEQTRKTFARHGAPVDQMFGVKVGDLKTIVKKIKGNQKLALDLYATGNSDAMYLAGLVADGSAMSKKELETWAKQATWHMISEYSVAWVASENAAAAELAMKWIKNKSPKIAATGWATYSSLVSFRPDEALDLSEIQELLELVGQQVHQAPERVAYSMNNFVICVGSYVKPLLAKAKAIAKKIGVVSVDMGETACKVPLASEYIAKVESIKRVGQKRKNVRC
ncbi:MAG: DNA alkylation repair protein [Planctomycetaceae bacterium]|nr:DNA alkylation repair protein [Planctomycetaceae bacterium]